MNSRRRTLCLLGGITIPITGCISHYPDGVEIITIRLFNEDEDSHALSLTLLNDEGEIFQREYELDANSLTGVEEPADGQRVTGLKVVTDGDSLHEELPRSTASSATCVRVTIRVVQDATMHFETIGYDDC